MRRSTLEHILTDIGLTENESRVYLAALSLGSASIQKMSVVSEIKRTTVYSVVESLKLKGLISIEVHGLKRRYRAADPSLLESLLESKRERFKKAFPDLQALYNLKGDEHFIRYHEGIEGVKHAFNDLLEHLQYRDEYLVIASAEEQVNLAPTFFHDFFIRRAKRSRKLKVSIRLLLEDSLVSREYKKNDARYNSTSKILPQRVRFSTNFVLIPRRIIIFQVTPPVLVVEIENRSTIQTIREMFDLIWETIE